MNPDHFGLQPEFDVDDFFSFSENKEPLNHRLFQDPFLIDFESIQQFLDLEPQKTQPRETLLKQSNEKSTKDNIILIELESEANISSTDPHIILQESENISPPSPCESKITLASISQKKRQKNHSMNNMPGFLISAIRSRIIHLKFEELDIMSLNNLNQVSNCFYELIDVILKIRSKIGNRKQLRMAFNEIDLKEVETLNKRMNLSKAQEKYLDIVKTHPKQILNEAKQTLRKLLHQSMTLIWIHEYSQTRLFTSQEKKTTFEKYLTYFRKQLQEGNVRQLVNRKQVLSMDPFQQGRGQSAQLFHFTSHTCHEEPKIFMNTSLRRFQ